MNLSRKITLGIVIVMIVGIAASAYIVSSITTNLQNQINLLQVQSSQLNQKNTDLQNQVTQLKDKSSELEANYTNLLNQTSSLQERSSQLETNVTTLYGQLNPNLTVTFWKLQSGQDGGSGTSINYVFNVTGTRESFQLATSNAINQVLAPLVSKYPFVTMVAPSGTIIPFWTIQYVGNGQFYFTLSLKNELNNDQLQSLTQDLSNALEST